MTEADEAGWFQRGVLPPWPTSGASDAERARAVEARLAARYGAPTLRDYRRAYAGFGADWPGDGEIARRHIVARARTRA